MAKLNILSVSQLNRYVKAVLEENKLLAEVYIKGELSNVKDHFSSGHLYFTLKDEKAAVKAVMFKSYAQTLRFRPEDGLSVLVRASVSLYERDGSYQLYVTDIQPDGLGSLHLAYEQLRKKLEAEGLFDPARKQPIPSYPQRIAVVTSQSGAALHDVETVISRRFPACTLLVVPVVVQGRESSPSIVSALRFLNRTKPCDLILLCRGGGSLEDLWSFNEEATVRAVAESELPVICGVGHETDVTLCDFAADLRAPTPSAAAELAVPGAEETLGLLEWYRQELERMARSTIRTMEERLDRVQSASVLADPMNLVDRNRQKLDNLIELLNKNSINMLSKREQQLAYAARLLDELSPLRVLHRGYAIVTHGGETVSAPGSVRPGDPIEIRLEQGKILAEVVKTDEKSNSI